MFMRKGTFTVQMLLACLLLLSQFTAHGKPIESKVDLPSSDEPYLQAVGGWLPVSQVSDLHGAEISPAIAHNPNGNTHLVVWERDLKIYGQVLQNRSLLGAPFKISTDLGANQAPDAAYVTSINKWIVVYEKGGYGIYARYLNANGTLSGDEFAVAENAGDALTEPAVAVNEAFAVVAYHRSQAPALHQIAARIVESASSLKPEVTLTDLTGPATGSPDIAYNPYDSLFLVVWSQDSAGNADIYAQILDINDEMNLIKIHGSFPIHNLAQPETNPAIAALPMMTDNGQYLVAAQVELSGSSTINGRLMQWDGSPQTDIFTISLSPGSTPAVTAGLNACDYMVAWQQPDKTLMARRITDTSLSTDPLIPLGGTDAAQPSIAPSRVGRFAVVQQGTPSTLTDIYLRHIGFPTYLPAIQK